MRWTPPRLRGQQARAVISLSSGLIRWSSSVKCHSASIIRISLTRPSRLHAEPYHSCERGLQQRGPLSFLFWAELQRAGGLWNSCTSLEAVYTSREAKQKKMHDFLRGRRLTRRLHLLISERLEKATVTDCGIPPFVVFLYAMRPDDL